MDFMVAPQTTCYITLVSTSNSADSFGFSALVNGTASILYYYVYI